MAWCGIRILSGMEDSHHTIPSIPTRLKSEHKRHDEEGILTQAHLLVEKSAKVVVALTRQLGRHKPAKTYPSTFTTSTCLNLYATLNTNAATCSGLCTPKGMASIGSATDQLSTSGMYFTLAGVSLK